MQWLLGLDLRNHGEGALAYTRWLAQNLPTTETFVGVHVLETARLHQLLRHRHLSEVETIAKEAVARVVEEHDPQGVLDQARVESGRAAEQVLGEIAARPGLRGIVVGRQAKRGQSRLVHLGRVARRLLRTLPAPVTVVPPDLEVDDVGDGPVLLAVRPSIPAPGAAAYARALAHDTSRPLAVVHVMLSEAQVVNEMGTSTAMAQQYYAALREREERAFDEWIAEHGLQDATRYVREGLVLDELAAATQELRPPMIVCGSRRLTLAQRLFSSSVATDLAAVSRVPVTVVPDAGP